MERLTTGFALPAHTLLLSVCGLAPLDAPITVLSLWRVLALGGREGRLPVASESRPMSILLHLCFISVLRVTSLYVLPACVCML